MCTNVGVCVCVLSILTLSLSRMTKDFTVPPLPFALFPASFDFSASLPLPHLFFPLIPRQSDYRRSEWPAYFGPAAHLSGSVLFCAFRGKDYGDQERERGRDKEEEPERKTREDIVKSCH